MLEEIRRIYFSPNDDTKKVFLDWLNTATKSIHLADFSYNLPEVTDILLAKAKAGLTVRVVLDRSQSHGSTELVQVQRLRDANIDLVIGTSSLHQIMHSKYTVIDDTWVEYGSWNYTTLAPKQSNFFTIENALGVVNLYKQNWEDTRAWIVAHEAQTPPVKKPSFTCSTTVPTNTTTTTTHSSG